MEPAICRLCGKSPGRHKDGNLGDWVKFNDFDSSGQISLSHPQGLIYFCGDHIASAEALMSKDSAVAIGILIQQFDCIEPQTDKVKTWWQRLFKNA